MRIALAQINTIIADFAHNANKIVKAAQEAEVGGADMIVFPELAICGYPPLDLCHAPWFLKRHDAALHYLLRKLPPSLPALVGGIGHSNYDAGKKVQNLVFVLAQGEIMHRQAKTLLPNYDVFDESRFFEPAHSQSCVTIKGKRVAIGICEDIWYQSFPGYAHDPLKTIATQSPDILVVSSASPFTRDKDSQRLQAVQRASSLLQVPVIYVNSVGGNDTLVFDGGSIFCHPRHSSVFYAPSFTEGLFLVDTTAAPSSPAASLDSRESLVQALTLGLRDYVQKTGFSGVHLGLSGGIDSALVACLASRALGASQVTGILMPSPYSSADSVDDAKNLAEHLGIATRTIPITDIYHAFRETLAFDQKDISLTWENVQPRIRATLLMAYANEHASLLLNTGNKSELSVGYCTLYGDMAGALAIIGDIFKTEVYDLCRYINDRQTIIPENIIRKPPSAELRPGQKDTDSLPDYPVLDAMLRMFLLEQADEETLIAAGHPADEVRHVHSLILRSEFKRFQAPPVIKVSGRSFGSSRRIPIVMHPSSIEG